MNAEDEYETVTVMEFSRDGRDALKYWKKIFASNRTPMPPALLTPVNRAIRGKRLSADELAPIAVYAQKILDYPGADEGALILANVIIDDIRGVFDLHTAPGIGLIGIAERPDDQSLQKVVNH